MFVTSKFSERVNWGQWHVHLPGYNNDESRHFGGIGIGRWFNGLAGIRWIWHNGQCTQTIDWKWSTETSWLIVKFFDYLFGREILQFVIFSSKNWPELKINALTWFEPRIITRISALVVCTRNASVIINGMNSLCCMAAAVPATSILILAAVFFFVYSI